MLVLAFFLITIEDRSIFRFSEFEILSIILNFISLIYYLSKSRFYLNKIWEQNIIFCSKNLSFIEKFYLKIGVLYIVFIFAIGYALSLIVVFYDYIFGSLFVLPVFILMSPINECILEKFITINNNNIEKNKNAEKI